MPHGPRSLQQHVFAVRRRTADEPPTNPGHLTVWYRWLRPVNCFINHDCRLLLAIWSWSNCDQSKPYLLYTVPTNSSITCTVSNTHTPTAKEININIQQNIYNEWLYETLTPLHYHSAAVTAHTVHIPSHIIIHVTHTFTSSHIIIHVQCLYDYAYITTKHLAHLKITSRHQD